MARRPDPPQIIPYHSSPARNANNQGPRVNIPNIIALPPNIKLLPQEIKPLPQEVKPLVLKIMNPYLGLHRDVIDQIMRERDVGVSGNEREKAIQLHELDQILPEWIQSISSKNVNNFQILTGVKLIIFARINNVPIDDIANLNNRDLIQYIRIVIIMKDPLCHLKPMLSGLVANAPITVLRIIVCQLGILIDELQFIPLQDLPKIIIAGDRDVLDTKKLEAVTARFRLLHTHKYNTLIKQLYHEDMTWIEIAQLPSTKMEQIILNLDSYTQDVLAKTFGICIPIAFTNNTLEYIHNNIIHYLPLLDRKNQNIIPLDIMIFMDFRDIVSYISNLTDFEIFECFGIYVPYASRAELIESVAAAITTPRFMYPSAINPSRAKNTMTIMGNEITDPNIFKICYGTIFKYTVYELEELIGAFHQDDTGIMDFRKPENLKQYFSISDIESLVALIKSFPETPTINALLTRINQGLIDANDRIDHDNTAKNQLRVFSIENKNNIKTFLKHIFHVGMYMRRWKGPGDPFPLKEADTRNKPEPDEIVSLELGKGIEQLKMMTPEIRNFCMQLYTCEYNNNGTITQGRKRFTEDWNNVIAGELCIRMASVRFIGVGYHYLRSLFTETILGFDVKQIDKIT